MPKTIILENSLFICEHLELSRQNMDDVDSFIITNPIGKGLMDFLQQNAFHYENENLSRTYLIRDKSTNELAAYFSLKAGLISSELSIDEINSDKEPGFNVIPGIELSALAVNEAYLERHPKRKGCGLIIFNDFILPIARKASEIIGAQVLYGFSVDTTGKLMNRYLHDYGFERLDKESEELLHKRLRPQNEDNCTFIFQKI